MITITNMKINDRLFCNPIDIADAFNTYFSSIAEKHLMIIPPGTPLLIIKNF
jgi:hypothetical protein